jgi:hypothetical protein
MSTDNVFLISLVTDKAAIITTYGETNNKRANNLTNKKGITNWHKEKTKLLRKII